MVMASLIMASLVLPDRDWASELFLPRQKRFDLLDDIRIKGEGPCPEGNIGDAYCPGVGHGEHAICDCTESKMKKVFLCLDTMLLYRGGEC